MSVEERQLTSLAGAHRTPRTGKGSRVSAACIRCQRRKIRCDGLLPCCKPCQRAGAECVNGSNHRGRGHEIPRIQLAEFKARVAWLEDIVRNRCPDVDLSEGPPVSVGADDFPRNGRSSRETEPEQTQQATRPMEYISPASTETQMSSLDHELGLVSSSAGADQRYVGASSGYFFAKLLLTTVGERDYVSSASQNSGNKCLNACPSLELILQTAPSPLPQNRELAIQLSSTYFETVHTQFPFLHQPTHEANIHLAYDDKDEAGPVVLFQVNMVLAVATTMITRRVKVALSPEGFCISALKYLEQIDLTGSLKGLQCTLLLLILALNSPSPGLNMWYLHHQCIAALIDLGLHCNLPSRQHSLIEEQLGRRAFMCIYTMDQNLSMIMGRPAGLRDEDCSCELPEDVEDHKLLQTHILPREVGAPPTNMSNAIHLFRLARMMTEIRYILHPGSPNSYSTYARASEVDLTTWQQDMLSRLRAWVSTIPVNNRDDSYITELSEIKYHNVVMLLLRPSQSIRQPSETSLKLCYESAIQSLRIYNSLYKRNVLAYSWVTIHSIFLSSLTMLYCVWVLPGLALNIRMDIIVSDLKAASDVLSATGEHWPQARRCRDALENLSNSTVSWLSDLKQRRGPTSYLPENQNWMPGSRAARGVPMDANQNSRLIEPSSTASGDIENVDVMADMGLDSLEPIDYLNPDVFSSLFRPNGELDGQSDVNMMFQGIFSDFQPVADFL